MTTMMMMATTSTTAAVSGGDEDEDENEDDGRQPLRPSVIRGYGFRRLSSRAWHNCSAVMRSCSFAEASATPPIPGDEAACCSCSSKAHD